jgi:hypothetical protein
MRSPLITSGTIRVDTLPDDGLPGLIARVEQALRRVRAARLQVSGDTISFRGGFFRAVTNWNILVPISSGEIHFSRIDGSVLVRYRISFLGLFLMTTGLVLIPLFFFGDPIQSGVIFALPFMWLWLFGANYFTTRFRFPRFLASAAGATLPATQPITGPFPDY